MKRLFVVLLLSQKSVINCRLTSKHIKMKLSLMLATTSLAAAVPRRPPVTNPTDDVVTTSVELTQNVIKGNWLLQIFFFLK